MENAFTAELAQKAMESRSPAFGQFELTPSCNLNCQMCYIKGSEQAVCDRKLQSASFWLKVAEQIAEEGTLVLSLTGGETLLYPELDALMDGLQPLGFLISFNTNGTLIDEKRVQWFLEHRPTKINISLYGATDATYERLCGLKDGFTRVSKAIRMLQENGLNVYLNGVIVEENMAELPAMYDYARSVGLDLHLTGYCMPPLHAQTSGRLERFARLSPEEAARSSYLARQCDIGEDSAKQELMSLALRTAIQKQALQEAEVDQCFSCRGGRCSFAVNWEGKLQICALAQRLSYDLHKISFADGWKLLTDAVETYRMPKKCAKCEKRTIYCPVCMAALEREQDAFGDEYAYLCAYSEAYAALAPVAVVARKEDGDE